MNNFNHTLLDKSDLQHLPQSIAQDILLKKNYQKYDMYHFDDLHKKDKKPIYNLLDRIIQEIISKKIDTTTYQITELGLCEDEIKEFKNLNLNDDMEY